MRVSAAREIAEGVGGMRIYPEGSRYQPRQSDIIINWGRSNLGDYGNGALCDVYNDRYAVQRAVNKLETYRLLTEAGVPTVEWTTDGAVAYEWCSALPGPMDRVAGFARTHLTGRGGAGMVPIRGGTEYGPEGDVWPRAPLYTRYFKKRREFRVHVWGNQMIDLQEKRKRRGADADRYIRSHDNGWIFARQGVTCPAAVSEASVAAVRALGLQFGAVDIGWNEHYQRPCVFEVNTAPGIEGTTVSAYVNKIKELAA